MLAYTKSVNMTEMVRTEFPDDPYLEPDLVRYFPTVLQQRYRSEILDHRLRREIIATQVANQMVNLSGISFDNRMTEDTGAGVVDVMRAWVAARDIFNFPTMWDQIEALPTHVKLDTQLELFLEARRMVERAALWLLRHRRPPLEIATVVAEFKPGITELLKTLESHLRGKVRDQLFANEAARLAAGVPESVAQRSVAWPLMHTSFDIIDLATRQNLRVRETAAAYWEVFDALDRIETAISGLRGLQAGRLRLAVSTTGKYFWVPTHKVEFIEFEKTQRPRDLLWRQATVEVRGGPEGVVFIPATYPMTPSGPVATALRLGRATDWSTDAAGPVRGIGQRMFLAGEEGVGMDEITAARFGSAT